MLVVRKLIFIFAFLVLVIGLVIAAASFALPKDFIISSIKNQVLVNTGREISLSDVKLTLWPNIGVELKDVKFSNYHESSFENMFSVENLKVAIAVKPLLHKKFKLQKIELVEPHINIEILDNNKSSFTFDVNKDASVNNSVSAEEVIASPLNNFKVEFDEFKIKNAKVNFINKGDDYKFDNVNLDINFPNLDSVLKVEGGFKYRDEDIGVYISLDNPLDLLNNKTSKGTVRVVYGRSKAVINGVLAKQIENLDADIDVDIRSISNVLLLLDKSDLIDKIGFSRAKLLGKLSAEENNLTIAKADIELDDIKAAGSLDIDLGVLPSIFARLTTNKIDADKLIYKFKKDKSNNSDEGNAESSNNEDKIDLSMLKKFDMDLILQTDGFIFDKVDMGRLAVEALLKDGELKLSLDNATIYNGKVSSKLNINSRLGIPAISGEIDAKGVDAKPFLTKLAKFSKASGKLDASVTLNSVGYDFKNLTNNLKGKGSLSFRNGEFEGIDLLKIAELAQKKEDNLTVGEGSTKFASLNATFTIDKGIASNNDLRMSSPVLNVKGSGTVNLPSKTVKYDITSILLSEGGKKEGVSIPLIVSGGFNNIKVTPNFKNIIEEVVKNPAIVKEKAKEIKDDIKETVKNIKENIKEEGKSDPVKAIKNLFGKFFTPANSGEEVKENN